MKVRVRIDTISEMAKFVLVANTIKGKVNLVNDSGLCVDAKSFLGVAHASEFKNLWCVCEEDIYSKLTDFIVVEDVNDDTN